MLDDRGEDHRSQHVVDLLGQASANTIGVGAVDGRDEGRELHTAAEVQARFGKAKVLNGERVRFDVAGGDYRLIASFKFKNQIVFVKFLGTHAEYDRVNALTVSLF